MQALLNTNQELKQFVAVSSGMEISPLLPYLVNSEAEQQIKEVCGQTVYTNLLNAYLNNSLSAAQEALLPYAQKPLANLAVYHHLQQGGVIVSNSGVTLSTDRDKQAFQWQQAKLENSLLNQAYFALDTLIAYLEANQASFATWATESNYAQSRDFFINSSQAFNTWVNIKNNYRTLVALRPVMANIEANTIKNTLGDVFYTHLKNAVKTGTLATEEEGLIENYIQPAVANLTIAEAARKLNFDVTADGAFLHSLRANSNANIAEKNAPDTEQRDAFINLHMGYANTWLENLVSYLNETADPATYPLYYNSSLYLDPTTTEVNFGVDVNDDTQKIWY